MMLRFGSLLVFYGAVQLGTATEARCLEDRCQSADVKDEPVNLLQESLRVDTKTGMKRAIQETSKVEKAFTSELQVNRHPAGWLSAQHDDHHKDIVALNPKDGMYKKWQDKPKSKIPSQNASIVVLLFFIAMAAGATYAILGLGTALVFHMSLPLAADLLGTYIASIPGIQQASVYIMLCQPAITAFQAWNLRNAKRNWPFLLTYAGSTFVGLGGGMLLLYLSNRSPTATFACKVLLLFSCAMTLANEAYKRLTQICYSSKSQDVPVDMGRQWTVFTVITCGALAGFLQGAIAVGGTFKMMLIVTLNIANEEWRATQCLADLPLQFTRIVIVLSMGIIPWGAEWPSILGVLAGMGVGVCGGNYVAKSVPQSLFTAIVLAGIAGTSILMAIHMLQHPTPTH